MVYMEREQFFFDQTLIYKFQTPSEEEFFIWKENNKTKLITFSTSW